MVTTGGPIDKFRECELLLSRRNRLEQLRARFNIIVALVTIGTLGVFGLVVKNVNFSASVVFLIIDKKVQDILKYLVTNSNRVHLHSIALLVISVWGIGYFIMFWNFFGGRSDIVMQTILAFVYILLSFTVYSARIIIIEIRTMRDSEFQITVR